MPAARIKTHTARLGIPLTPDDLGAIRAAARRLRVSMAGLVRLAVRAWLNDHQERREDG